MNFVKIIHYYSKLFTGVLNCELSRPGSMPRRSGQATPCALPNSPVRRSSHVHTPEPNINLSFIPRVSVYIVCTPSASRLKYTKKSKPLRELSYHPDFRGASSVTSKNASRGEWWDTILGGMSKFFQRNGAFHPQGHRTALPALTQIRCLLSNSIFTSWRPAGERSRSKPDHHPNRSSTLLDWNPRSSKRKKSC